MTDNSEKRMPVLFIGHGSPMNMVLKNSFTENLAKLGKNLPTPRAIMVISAHWLTRGTFIGCMVKPKMIYDFYGFPDELYEIEYPSPGSPSYARSVKESVKKIKVECNESWGLDHASYAILRHIYPKADIPVFEMSIDYTKPAQHHYDLALGLAPLREKGLLIIGSGNIVHNLGLADFYDMDAEPYEWAVEFDDKVKSYMFDKNHDELIDYQSRGRLASLAVPTNDHYLPMIYTIALQEKSETLKFTHEGFQNASVSMRCFQIG